MKAVANIWEKFAETKLFIAILALGAIALVGFGGPAVVSNFQSQTAEGYTGTAVVQSHKVSGSFCKVEVTYAGNTETKTFGPKASCSKVTDQMEVQMVKGDITK